MDPFFQPHCNLKITSILSSSTDTMFGAFRPTNSLGGGLLWYIIPSIPPQKPNSRPGHANSTDRKIPWRLSKFQKARQRKRLRAVDAVISTVDKALAKQGIVTKAIVRWKEDMPKEEEMLPKDKYTIFDRKEKKYRKGIHSEFL